MRNINFNFIGYDNDNLKKIYSDIEIKYNEKNGITPQTIKKSVRDTIKASIVEDIQTEYNIKEDEDIKDVIDRLTKEMIERAQNLEFEKAAELRDKIKELENIV